MYACLSHCWGTSGPTLKLDKKTYTRFTDGMLIDRLPKTFADAANLCARLGLRFIWIDACCIMQDDNDDWKEAAATMATIYEQAHLTIAAIWAGNSDRGLFASDRERYKAKRLKDHELYILECSDDFPLPDSTKRYGFPLLRRAWAYQERVLSSRMVHFGKDQVGHQCPLLPETYNLQLPKRYRNSVELFMGQQILLFATIEDPVDRWHKVETMYSGLELTYSCDRLPAIAAIVEREIRIRPDDIYIAGMWKNSLLPDLAWTSGDGQVQAWCPQIRYPTWAWPSSQAQVLWFSGPLEPSLRLVDLSYAHVGPAHVGQVTNASITLEGHVLTVWFKKSLEKCPWNLVYCMEIVPRSLPDIETCFAYMDFDWATGDRPVTIGDSLVIVPITLLSQGSDWPHYSGLILRKVTDGVFERIGIVDIQAIGCSEMTTMQSTQIICDYVEALPIRQVKII
ncbi:hypothetical protein G6011_01010 [Alternaria panax]|uniref:Heterokaryon incompatibility domain-containing protein n=1 Tax=Alternaria panax TaxID=48097 RepID=A0AAD4IKB4_9PLEO|nr:hypothetical protein G6011_01010 [Alternaria panax]